MVLLLQSCNVEKNGTSTPDQLVEQYLSALENKDEKLMLGIMPEHSVLTREIRAKIAKVGGYKIKSRQIIYNKSTSVLWNAQIKGVYIDHQNISKKLEDIITIQYQNKGNLKAYAGRWYLLTKNTK
jgi:hypothetical protein